MTRRRLTAYTVLNLGEWDQLAGLSEALDDSDGPGRKGLDPVDNPPQPQGAKHVKDVRRAGQLRVDHRAGGDASQFFGEMRGRLDRGAGVVGAVRNEERGRLGVRVRQRR